jgi:hypothetical protein
VLELLHLLQNRDFEPDPTALKCFVMLGLVDEKPDGFALTELGRQRLDAEQRPGLAGGDGKSNCGVKQFCIMWARLSLQKRLEKSISVWRWTP